MIIIGLVVLSTILFALLCMVVYFDRSRMSGTIHVTESGEKKIFTLEVHGDPDQMENGDMVVFEVKYKEEG